MRRLLRGIFKLSIIAGVAAALVAVGRKLMGGLGPEPGSEQAPKEWPSLVPEPETAAATASGNGNGNGSAPKPKPKSSSTSEAAIDWTAQGND